MNTRVELSEVGSHYFAAPVEFAALVPEGCESVEPLPVVLVLMGGGGSRQSLVECQPLFERWWQEGILAPMALATPSAGVSYYLEDAASGLQWESFLRQEFIPHLRANLPVGTERGATALMGISMGGCGVLKLSFAHPAEFKAVAAMNPMLEPGLRDEQIGQRNRLHHSAGGPAALIGAARDAAVFAANNPANRARENAARIRESELAIFLEAGDDDFVNAHDGTEFLHRVLWDLDISHEYRLARGGDHGGPTFRPRMRAAFAWLSEVLTRKASASPSPEQRQLDAMRASMQPLREQAAATDPTANRRFGILPSTS